MLSGGARAVSTDQGIEEGEGSSETRQARRVSREPIPWTGRYDDVVGTVPPPTSPSAGLFSFSRGADMEWFAVSSAMGYRLKALNLSDAAFRLHVEALCFCAENETDGSVPLPFADGRKR